MGKRKVKIEETRNMLLDCFLDLHNPFFKKYCDEIIDIAVHANIIKGVVDRIKSIEKVDKEKVDKANNTNVKSKVKDGANGQTIKS